MFCYIAPYCTGHFQNILQIGTAIFIRRRTYCTEQNFHFIQTFGKICRKMQSPGLLVTMNHFFQPGFINGYDAFLQILNLLGVYVYAKNFGSHFSETGSCYQAYIACTNYCYFHKLNQIQN